MMGGVIMKWVFALIVVVAVLLVALGGAAGSGEEKHASKDVNGC